MSTKTGQAGNRKRPQKYQNAFAWKAGGHKSATDPKTKLLQSLTVTNCCTHCTGVIEWKIKWVELPFKVSYNLLGFFKYW